MTQDSDPSTPAAPDGADALAETQSVEVPRFTPTPDPRPDTRWAWATRDPRPSGAAPAPGLADAASWEASTRRQGWAAPASSATASWAPADAGGGCSTAAPSWSAAGVAGASTPALGPSRAGPAGRPAPARRRSGPGIGTVTAVALLSAIVASSSTALVLNATGALTQPAAPPAANTSGLTSGTAGTPGAGGTSGTTDESSAVISAAAKVSPAVVKITTQGASSDPFSSQGDGVGSGIIFDPNGWIVTNHHVVTGADTLTVELKDGRSFDGTVYGIDTLTDLAIVKVDATGLPAATLGSSDGLKVGQLVVAVGSPLGTYSFSVTSGIVSGKGRSIIVSDGSTITNLIQTDAAINPGNSGGPLADADGNVVGINTAIADGSNGIGFAIPIDIAKPIMGQAVKGEKLERPWIGVRFETVDQKVKTQENLSVDNGALIVSDSTSGGSAVVAGSPAEAAGLQEGDVITAINGIALDQEHPLNLLLVQFSPNDTIQLTVIRDGATITVPVTLGVRPDNLQ